MSAIFGILERAGTPAGEADEGILKAMAGPAGAWGDDLRTHRAGRLGAGLVLSDVSLAAASPFIDPRWPALTLIADVNLYARDELRAKLEDTASGDVGDSQLLLAAYARWGDGCVDHLEGAFAFALWDAERQRLVCARDHIGERPFYYHASADRFVFGTDVGSVLAAPGVPKEHDPDVILAHYARAYELIRGRSFFRGVLRLPPGHTLVLDGDDVHVRRWWSPPAQELRLPSIDDYAAALRSEIERAVAIRMNGAARVGVHLSGGLDSSCVAALAARELSARGGGRPLAFSWTPSSAARDGTDEAPLVQAVCEDNGLDCHFVDFNAADMLATWTRDFTLLPTATQIEEQHVCRSAGAQGVDVLLTGWGGDEGASFNGRGYLAGLAASGQWPTLLRELRVVSHARPLRALRTLWSSAILPALPDSLAIPLAGLSPRAFHERRALRRIITAEPDLSASGPAVMRAHRRFRERRSPRRCQWDLLNHGHLAYRLEAWARLGAEHGVTYRHPLLDRRVLELCLAMPPWVWKQGRSSRLLFRVMCRDLLPARVLKHATKRDPALMRAREAARVETMTQCAELMSSPDRELARRARMLQIVGHAP